MLDGMATHYNFRLTSPILTRSRNPSFSHTQTHTNTHTNTHTHATLHVGQNNALQDWLDVDEEEGSDHDAQPTPTGRAERDGGHADRPPAVRPELHESAPQWMGFRQRRSSVLSCPQGSGSVTPPAIQTEHSKVTSLKIASRLEQRVGSAGSRSPSGQPKPLRAGAAERDRDGSCSLMRSPCTETGSPTGAADEPAFDRAGLHGRCHSRPRFGVVANRRGHRRQHRQRNPQMHPDAEEISGDARSAAGAGAWCAASGRQRDSTGIWKLDRSVHGNSFSEFSIVSEGSGSRSSIDVHNFLEEFVGSSGEDRNRTIPCGVDSRGVEGGGEVRDSQLRPAWNGGSQHDHGHREAGGSGLDARDAEELLDGENSREVLLAIEDLHFGERFTAVLRQ